MRKRFGQNFLVNAAAREKLFDALDLKAGDTVWEIGPGLGAMTKGLLERGARLTAFEVDPGFCKILRELFPVDINFSLIEGDAFQTWPPENNHLGTTLPLFMGNLPYNIGAAMLADFMEKDRLFSRMVVTVQKETAERMAAKPGTSDYSSFSVLCSSLYRVKTLMTLKSSSFYPAPRVESRGVLLELLPPGERVTEEPFRQLVRSLFSSRRKTIKNNLINFVSSAIVKGSGDAAKTAEEALALSGISGSRRAETLSVFDFSELSAALRRIGYEQ